MGKDWLARTSDISGAFGIIVVLVLAVYATFRTEQTLEAFRLEVQSIPACHMVEEKGTDLFGTCIAFIGAVAAGIALSEACRWAKRRSVLSFDDDELRGPCEIVVAAQSTSRAARVPLPCAVCSRSDDRVVDFSCGISAHPWCMYFSVDAPREMQCRLCGALENGEKNTEMTDHYAACRAGISAIVKKERLPRAEVAMDYLASDPALFFRLVRMITRVAQENRDRDLTSEEWRAETAVEHIKDVRARLNGNADRPCAVCMRSDERVKHFSCGASFHARCVSSPAAIAKDASCPQCGSPEGYPGAPGNVHFTACAAGISVLRAARPASGPVLVRALDQPGFYQHMAAATWRVFGEEDKE